MFTKINNYSCGLKNKEKAAKKLINDKNMIKELTANYELYKYETGDNCKFIDFVIGAYIEID